MAAATALLIARHGEAHCNRDQIVGGPRGCRGLTDRGRDQVHHLARRLHEQRDRYPITALYTTPLPRAHQSAAIIATALGIPATIEPDLREQDYGDADGRPWTDVVAAFGGIPSLEPDRPIANRAETWTSYLARSSRALGRILARHQGETILIVGHGETIDTTFHRMLGLLTTSRAGACFAAHTASLTIWQQQPVSWTRPHAGLRWMLLTHNDIGHLPDGADGQIT